MRSVDSNILLSLPDALAAAGILSDERTRLAPSDDCFEVIVLPEAVGDISLQKDIFAAAIPSIVRDRGGEQFHLLSGIEMLPHEGGNYVLRFDGVVS